ncbi:hypothetical protein Afil01_56960 [Actinorhabdospora filicis]|uniref:Uncharacterized protein n=1 Tax=Actinorhabdospora filicis TaxID=1785913 RepID=A0A9W6SRZ3_9ACTN|nr:permease prefix domain 1-containing protein [Actinorhabdospora filicis]GLZ80889.1 hypothetical protein Afil01_56960 [Actinorhabdospora filicis]
MDPIAEHLSAMRAALLGSRRRVDDLLREARHGMEDAAEAFEADGVSPPEAARMAVADFGTVAQVAPDYQVELAAGVTRRALLFLALLTPVGNITAWFTWHDAPPLTHAPLPGTFQLATAMDVLSWTVTIASVLGALAVTVGGRWIAFRPSWAAAAGISIFTMLTLTMTLGFALTVLFAAARDLPPYGMVPDPGNLGYLAAWGALLWTGTRCLRSGRRALRLVAA